MTENSDSVAFSQLIYILVLNLMYNRHSVLLLENRFIQN